METLPEGSRNIDTTALPSRCSGAATMMPQLAKEPHSDEYVLQLPARPCEKISKGYGVALGATRALGTAGMEM